MSAKLTKLVKQARVATRQRNHEMIHFGETFQHNGGEGTNGYCIECKREVHIRTHPQPNEIEIGGEAVALNCGPEQQSHKFQAGDRVLAFNYCLDGHIFQPLFGKATVQAPNIYAPWYQVDFGDGWTMDVQEKYLQPYDPALKVGGGDVTSQPDADPTGHKFLGKALRKEIHQEREYLEALIHCTQHLLSAARDGDPHKVYEAGQYVIRTLECFPPSNTIRIDLHL